MKEWARVLVNSLREHFGFGRKKASALVMRSSKRALAVFKDLVEILLNVRISALNVEFVHPYACFGTLYV